MKVPVNVMKFRTELASSLDKLYELLFDVGLNLIGDFSVITSMLRNGRAKAHPEKATEATFWGYELDNFVIDFTKNPRNVAPDEAVTLKLLFEVHVISDFTDLNFIQDPFNYLTFNVVILGKNGEKEYINAWHLDRHLGGDTDEAHPIYHMHYGGAKMNTRNLGETLLLDAPRLVHYPMEFILGIDFILSNFFPEEWNLLIEETEYPIILKRYQNYFLKPYFYALTSHWNKNLGIEINWQAKNVCPTLI
ncbi:hypothetical protein ACN9K5_04215 [Aliarcobacter butzleri]|uniref:hypothetical protein n=1 Tax=Aliarcobacter butzleri TaxID=28197 RepID=UPI003B2272AC